MDRIAAARDAVVCFRFDLVELHRCCTLRRRLSRHTYFLLTDCLTSSLVPIKPWDESCGVIRPTVEVEEFCQSCPEAAHPHTAYVNNLYVYPLSLNYSFVDSGSALRNQASSQVPHFQSGNTFVWKGQREKIQSQMRLYWSQFQALINYSLKEHSEE